MKEVLFNLALLDAIRFCEENNIDCSGTHLIKYPRKFIYQLCRDRDGLALVTLKFYKNQATSHAISSNLL